MPAKKSTGRRKYGPKLGKKVGRAVREMKHGKLRSGGKAPKRRSSSTSRAKKSSRSRSHASH